MCLLETRLKQSPKSDLFEAGVFFLIVYLIERSYCCSFILPARLARLFPDNTLL